MLLFVTTGDGSKTIYNSEVGENYHSKHGALQESRHVFLKSGLEYYLEQKVSPTGGDLEAAVSILEVGFGTGLNFLLSTEYCLDKCIRLNYTGIEAYPLSMEMIAQTGYGQYVAPAAWQNFIRDYQRSLTGHVQIDQFCQLQITNCKLTDFKTDQQYDVIYFDAFASAHQPEMWTKEAIAHTISFLKPGGIFVTYAITGDLKRTMKSLGLQIEKAPGAPGKREMLRASRPA
jgi:tRNA U34 5-methylaminomethyl-2-thiouridine-forming methyltransferase MnmC